MSPNPLAHLGTTLFTHTNHATHAFGAVEGRHQLGRARRIHRTEYLRVLVLASSFKEKAVRDWFPFTLCLSCPWLVWAFAHPGTYTLSFMCCRFINKHQIREEDEDYEENEDNADEGEPNRRQVWTGV
jgi:hypothetical protein